MSITFIFSNKLLSLMVISGYGRVLACVLILQIAGFSITPNSFVDSAYAQEVVPLPRVPTCPPINPNTGNPDQNSPIPPKTKDSNGKEIDKDGDGKTDRMYLKIVDKNGNDIQVWCLDHGPNGDYAVYASTPGRADRKIARCAFICGINAWSIDITNDTLNAFWGINWDPRLLPNGTGKDLEFHYDYKTNELKVIETKDKYPKFVRTVSYSASSLTDFYSAHLSVNSTEFDEFTASVAKWLPEYGSAGIGEARFIDMEEFERITGHFMTPFNIIYHPVGIVVNDARFDQSDKSLIFSVSPIKSRELSIIGELSVIIPREVLDSRTVQGTDRQFKVEINGEPIESEEFNSDTDRIVYIQIPKTTREEVQIRISGTEIEREIRYSIINSRLSESRGTVVLGKVSLVDLDDKTILSPVTGQQLLVDALITNSETRRQSFACIVQVKDVTGITQSLSWITGELAAKDAFRISQSWIPEKPGKYTIEVFIWSSLKTPIPLSSSRTLDVVIS